jgi:hypothetical protein
VFVAQDVLVNVSFPVARQRLGNLMRAGTLFDASGKAYAEGLVGMIRVGPFGDVLGASKLVQVRMLEPVPRADTVVLPLRWEATGVMGRLFPVLDADLVLTPEGEQATRLALTGAYRPPLGGLGSGLDRMVLRHAAAATIRSLLERVAVELADPEPETNPGTVPGAAAEIMPGTESPDLAISPWPLWNIGTETPC